VSEPAAERRLRAALEELAGTIARSEAPTRQDARAVLVALGALIETGRGEELLERTRELVDSASDAWRAAWREVATSELSLACAEHVHSVDPRYLGRPDYDLEYTRSARRRLDQRLRAAVPLGLEVSPALRARVLEADRLLEGLGTREGREPS
jgi:hypothetical protein